MLVAERVSAGVAPVSLILELSLKLSAPVPVAAIVPVSAIVKLRAVVVLVAPVNSRVAPPPMMRLAGLSKALMPRGLAVLPLPKSATARTAPTLAIEVTPV